MMPEIFGATSIHITVILCRTLSRYPRHYGLCSRFNNLSISHWKQANMHWLEFVTVNLPEGTCHSLNDQQFQAIRMFGKSKTPTPAFQWVESSGEVRRHFFTDDQIKMIQKFWPLPERFIELKMKSGKASAIAVIDKAWAKWRYIHQYAGGEPREICILPGARLGKVEDSLDADTRKRRDSLFNCRAIVQELGQFTLKQPVLFSDGTHAASFVVGSRQALNTYALDIDDVRLDKTPMRKRNLEYFERQHSD